MADVTKDPTFTSDADIQQENERRKKSIEEFQAKSAGQIDAVVTCTLTSLAGLPLVSKAGEALYVHPKWLVAPEDRKEYDALMSHVFWWGYNDEIFEKLKAMAPRGSDYLRKAVGRAARWACVPVELLAAVLQNENSPKATAWDRDMQNAERNLQALVGSGSTGFGNVTPETLKSARELFRKFYKISILSPGMSDLDQNQSAENDIYHAAAVLRDGLNRAWSAGSRSLNAELSRKYLYYPYFGGTVSEDVAIRAMGHYNGMGDAAKKYGEDAMNRIKKQTLHFHPPKTP